MAGRERRFSLPAILSFNVELPFLADRNFKNDAVYYKNISVGYKGEF